MASASSAALSSIGTHSLILIGPWEGISDDQKSTWEANFGEGRDTRVTFIGEDYTTYPHEQSVKTRISSSVQEHLEQGVQGEGVTIVCLMDAAHKDTAMRSIIGATRDASSTAAIEEGGKGVTVTVFIEGSPDMEGRHLSDAGSMTKGSSVVTTGLGVNALVNIVTDLSPADVSASSVLRDVYLSTSSRRRIPIRAVSQGSANTSASAIPYKPDLDGLITMQARRRFEPRDEKLIKATLLKVDKPKLHHALRDIERAKNMSHLSGTTLPIALAISREGC